MTPGDESILPSVVALWDQTEPVDVHVSLPGRREGAQHAAFSKLTTDILRDNCWSECGVMHVVGGLLQGERPSENPPGSLLGGPNKYTAHMPCQGVQPEMLPSCLGGEELTPARALG